MKYRVITAAFDVRGPEPIRIPMNGDNAIGEYMAEEIIDTEENVLFGDCEDVWDVEDTVLAFWNRLNESDREGPYYTHNGTAKVDVIDVKPVGE